MSQPSRPKASFGHWCFQKKKVLLAILLGLGILSYGVHYLSIEWATSPTNLQMTLSDGRILAYHKVSEGVVGKTPLILIHGTHTNAGNWKVLVHALKMSKLWGPIYAMDRLGYGHSDSNVETRLGEHASSVRQLIHALEIHPVLVGQSYGGPVALKVAAEESDLVAGVVLVGAACDPKMNVSPGYRRFVAFCSPVVPTPWDHANAEIYWLGRENQIMSSELSSISTPIMVIHGTQDERCPYETTVGYLSSKLVSAERLDLHRIEGGGHNLHVTHSEEILKAISRFP